MNIVKSIEKLKIGKVEKNVSLKKYTTYRAGGTAKVIVSPKSIDKLLELLKLLKDNNVEYKILGNGSNLIFNDSVYEPVLIKLNDINHCDINNNVITVGAGYSLISLAMKVSRLGLTGMEFATGIPGTVGGAVYMNAGAYKSDMGYIVTEVKAINENLEIVTLYNKDLKFKYRSSFFQTHKNYICIEATIKLKYGSKKLIKEVIEDRRQKRISTQPLEYPSAGSVFRNPENDYAWRLINVCGLKGYRIGGAMVSEKHANFIINVGNAKGEDIRNLILYVKDTVKKETGVDLKVEQEFVNWE
ncbi:MAG: UDP-N-acetylmuramate dehydrogenase [bacterium]|nr:UDP-N-acetylmuramate dehydrogenase [bacterium]